MRLILTLITVLIFFAANSVLARAGLVGGGISPAAFTAIRIAAGAATLRSQKPASEGNHIKKRINFMIRQGSGFVLAPTCWYI